MSGFKKFLLQGDLVALAVAFVIGGAFATVVSEFTKLLLSLIVADADKFFEGTFGPFLNALFAFVLIAAVVYFFVVVPYTKAKERYFPDAPAGPSSEELLGEIRDLLAKR